MSLGYVPALGLHKIAEFLSVLFKVNTFEGTESWVWREWEEEMNVQEYKSQNPDLQKHSNLNTNPNHFSPEDVWDESMHYKVWHNA